MKTKTINLYEFSELSEKAKETALQNLWDINVDYNWWESVYEDAANVGIKITSFDIDRRQISGEFEQSAPETVESILSNHGKDCETYKTAMRYKNCFDLPSDETDEDKLEQDADEFLKDILEDYLIILHKEFEYLTSEEAILETIAGYTFTESGKLENALKMPQNNH